MPRGGARPGAGRKKGGRNRQLEPPSPAGETALEYLHRLMRSGSVHPQRRDWAAKLAVRFEPRVEAARPKGIEAKYAPPPTPGLGKKEQGAEAAQTAGYGTDWGTDLESPTPIN